MRKYRLVACTKKVVKVSYSSYDAILAINCQILLFSESDRNGSHLAEFSRKGISMRSSLIAIVVVSATLFGSLLCVVEQARAYDIQGRWTNTQVDGGGHSIGDPLTLLWSVVPDGRSYSRASSSTVVEWLDDGWNVSTADRAGSFTTRPWWNVMNRAFQQLDRQTGLTFAYVAEPGSGVITPRAEAPDAIEPLVDVSGFTFGDIRIGGSGAFGDSSAIADNAFPSSGGDMRINTGPNANSFWTRTTRNLYNLITHEVGHGLGLSHDQGSETFIMHPTLQTSIMGPQWDMIYALNRNYGDPLEENGGNDTSATAIDLGIVRQTNPVLLGEDAVDFAINELDTEFLGIDTGTDTDWFRFSLDQRSLVDIVVTPVGPTYNSNDLGQIIGTERENLTLAIYDSGLNLISSLDSPIGVAETVTDLLGESGDEFFIRVQNDAVGASNRRNQFYTLEVSTVSAPIQVQGDFDGDGFVGLSDLNILGANFNTLGGASLADGDADGDGNVNLSDLNILGANWNPEPTVAVPEPTTLLLGMLAIGFAYRSRR